MIDPGLPATILVIRHGEKSGDKSDPHLNDLGRGRAEMLATQLPSIYPSLSVLFATAESTDSNRPYETIEPLARAMLLAIDNSFTNNQYSELATRIVASPKSYGGKTILICWHHEKIPLLIRDGFGQTGAPASWPDDVFDQIWQVDYSADGRSTFTITSEPPTPAG